MTRNATPARQSACCGPSASPRLVDTSRDPRLSRLFLNRTIRDLPGLFAEFHGMEETIERIVGFFRHAAQGLEERKQVLYLLGPVGGGKSSLGERLKLADGAGADLRAEGRRPDQPDLREPARPVRPGTRWRRTLLERYKIPRRVLTGLIASPWALKRLDEWGGDIQRFRVVKLYPVAPQADRRRQDRTRRRQQPGHLGPRRQGRYPQAGKLLARTTRTPTASRAA